MKFRLPTCTLWHPRITTAVVKWDMVGPMTDEQAHVVALTVRCERCGTASHLALRADQFAQFNQTGPTFVCDCGKSYSHTAGEAGHPGYVGHLPQAKVVSSPHVHTTARGVWECPGCGQRWHSELRGEAQDIDEAERSNPAFVCSCGSTLQLSKWIFQDAAADESGERPERRQNVQLTRTERQVLEQLVDGKSNAEIARHLSLSEGTVRNTASNLYRKLGVTNRLQAVQVSLNTGLVRPVIDSHDERHVYGL
jgi:DNA-binding CsgD family transcriptional regulator